MTDKNIYLNMVELIKKEVPGFEVRYKNENTVSKILGFLARIFNGDYMTRYTTTRGGKVYFPNREYVESYYRRAWRILAHEYVHLFDGKKHPFWFKFKYTFPQNLVVFSLGAIGAIWSPWFLLFLVFLGALAPIPSPGRRDAEIRGYSMTMAPYIWRDNSYELKENIADRFVGWDYYKMWPFREEILMILKDYEEELKFMKEGKPYHIKDDEPYLKILELLRKCNTIKN